MRVSESETSNLKIPETLKIFWPAWEPCREAANKYSDSIFHVRILPIPTYQPCKYAGMGMDSVDTLVCQIGGKIGELWKLLGKMSYSEGVHRTARSRKVL